MNPRFGDRPILVFWETTRACPLACRHCRADAQHDPLPGELTTDEGLLMITELVRFGRPRPVLVLTGGDCFQRHDLESLVAHARSLEVPVALSPSVSPSLDLSRLLELRRLGVRTVSLSLDGASPGTHDGIRGVAGHFDQTMEAMGLLRRIGFTVQVNTTVMTRNVEELADIAAVVSWAGVTVWEVFFLIAVGRGTGGDALAPADCEDVCHLLVDVAQRGVTVRTVEAPFFRRVAVGRRDRPTSRADVGPLYRRLAARLDAQLDPPRCRQRTPTAATRDGSGLVFIAHDGTILPSGFLPLRLGNVRTQSLVDVYRTDPLLVEIRAARFTGRCSACAYRQLCGGSRARAYAASGDPLGEDPACAHLPEGAVEPALASP